MQDRSVAQAPRAPICPRFPLASLIPFCERVLFVRADASAASVGRPSSKGSNLSYLSPGSFHFVNVSSCERTRSPRQSVVRAPRAPIWSSVPPGIAYYSILRPMIFVRAGMLTNWKAPRLQVLRSVPKLSPWHRLFHFVNTLSS